MKRQSIDAPNTKKQAVRSLISEKASTYKQLAKIFTDFENTRLKKREETNEEYLDLSFDAISTIFEFIDFSCGVTLARLANIGPLANPKLEHYSYMIKQFFGYQIGDEKRIIRLLFPYVSFCTEGPYHIFDIDVVYSERQGMFLPFLPRNIQSLFNLPATNDTFGTSNVDLTRFQQLERLSIAGIDHSVTMSLPKSLRYCDACVTSFDQLDPNLILLSISRMPSHVLFPHEKFKHLKSFESSNDLPLTTITSLLTSHLQTLDIPSTILEIYPGFRISETIHFLSVEGITIKDNMEFKLANKITWVRLFSKVSEQVWRTMFIDNEMDDVDLRVQVDEQVGMMVATYPTLVRLNMEGVSGDLIQKMFDGTPICNSLTSLIIDTSDNNYNMPEILNRIVNLEYADIKHWRDITVEDAIILHNHASITDLTLQECNMTDEVAEVLFTDTKLQTLTIGYGLITGTCLEVAAYNNTLTRLDLWYNNSLEQKYLQEFVAKNTTLEELHVEETVLLDGSFWDYFKTNTTLHAFTAAFKDEVMQVFISNVLRHCPNIVQLNTYTDDF